MDEHQQLVQFSIKVVNKLINKEYDVLDKEKALLRVSAEDIERVVNDYGGALTEIPFDDYDDIFYIYQLNDGSGYRIEIDLWINGEKSDLTLKLKLLVKDEVIYQYLIEDLLVM